MTSLANVRRSEVPIDFHSPPLTLALKVTSAYLAPDTWADTSLQPEGSDVSLIFGVEIFSTPALTTGAFALATQ